ncbi:hypothetical protein HZH68_000110 [Vespula germanica]|uniref:Uncharacterized protein n=1 Tax=Vespula germanica TaxID=30212 RepID=A0A834NSY3_VESGE|nr:hypothetical protein HZH68_000110 [Vespula germanica]
MARRIVLLNGIPAGSTIALIRSPSSAPLHDGMSLMLRSSWLVLFLRKISDTWAKQIPIWCTNLAMVSVRDKVASGAA